MASITIPEAFCRPSRAQRADIRDNSLARGRVAFRKVIDELAESDLAGGITHTCQTACRASTIPLWKASAAEPNRRAVNRPIQDQMGGSELGWQIPVDLEADTDLNKRRGCPGHSSFSLALPGTSNLDRARPPRKPPPPLGSGPQTAVFTSPWDSRGYAERRIMVESPFDRWRQVVLSNNCI